MTDFSDRPFVAGSLIGLRTFAPDRLGRLTGPQQGGVFKPGENEAVCLKSERSGGLWVSWAPGKIPGASPFTFSFHSYLTSEFDYEPPPETPLVDAYKAEWKRTRHQVGSLDCACGFYAYTDGTNQYKRRDRIAALIEGYGVCTVGSAGFRASKARLVALITPKRPREARWELVLNAYPKVPIYDTKSAALDAHPLTVDVPDPTAADFWTRDDA